MRNFESRNPGALFVALSRAKTAGNPQTDPDFAWHPHVLVNEDRLCHVVKTPLTAARTLETKRIETMSLKTKQQFHYHSTDDVFNHLLFLLNQTEE
jgi:hypothetical protein